MADPGEMRYGARVEWSNEDQVFIAHCPEFQGVAAHGSSVPEAVRELSLALEATVETYQEEGWSLPEAVMRHTYSGQFRLRVPKSLHAWLAQEAEREGVSLNTFVVARLSEARGARSEPLAVI